AAGWQRGADGVLANPGGDRFDITYRESEANQEALRVQAAVTNYWKDLGIRTTFDNVADTVFRDAREHYVFRGVSQQGGGTTIGSLTRRWHSTYIPGPDNRYLGDNLSFWHNP